MEQKKDKTVLVVNIAGFVVCTALILALIVLCIVITLQKKANSKNRYSEQIYETYEDITLADNVNGQALEAVEKEFYLIEEEGTIVIYEIRQGENTFYDYAAVEPALMTEGLRLQIKKGLYINTIEELYEFLQTYSS